MNTQSTPQPSSKLTTKLIVLTKHLQPPTQSDVDRPYLVAIYELNPQYSLPHPMSNRDSIRHWDNSGQIYRIVASTEREEKFVLAATTQDELSLMEFYKQIATDYHGGRMFMMSKDHQCLGTFLKENDAKRLEEMLKDKCDRSLESE